MVYIYIKVSIKHSFYPGVSRQLNKLAMDNLAWACPHCVSMVFDDDVPVIDGIQKARSGIIVVNHDRLSAADAIMRSWHADGIGSAYSIEQDEYEELTQFKNIPRHKTRTWCHGVQDSWPRNVFCFM